MNMRMNIPVPYLFQIDTPLIIFNGRLIQPNEKTQSDNNYLELNSEKYKLNEICTPRDLEDLYFMHNQEEFERYQVRYIEENLNQELKTNELLKKEIQENKVLSLIINDILPIITAQRLEEDVDNILREHEQSYMEDNNHGNNHGDNIGDNHEGSLYSPSGYQTHPETHQRISREVLAQVRRTKQQLLHQLDQEYEQYERIRGQRRVRNREHVNFNLEQRINTLLTDRSQRRSQNIQERSQVFDRLYGNSILNLALLSENIMLIGERVYDLINVREWISYFQQYMSAELYSRLQQISQTTHPNEITQVIRENILSIDKKCRSRIRNKLRESKLRINGIFYLPFYREDNPRFREDLVKRYKKLIEKKIKTDAIEHYEFQTQELQRIYQEKRKLERIARQQNYERKGAGFTIHNRRYYVYVTTPPYALKSPHISGPKKYVPFPRAKIGVKIEYDSYARSFVIGDPLILHRYKHPFLGNADGFSNICVGEGGKTVVSRAKLLRPEQAVIRLLDQGKKTLMMGYKTGSNPYPGASLKEDNWRTFLTKEEVRRRRLVCLNEDMVG